MSTFLIVDDHREAADSLAALLRLTGHPAHPAYSAKEALGQVKALDPDVFLLDLFEMHIQKPVTPQALLKVLGLVP